ncbi:MAG TPA: glycosyltransferase family 2 protein [Deinococcales bacterium]|nr:glycosyltransferase family 2 protein [Deinococcales bacterium]
MDASGLTVAVIHYQTPDLLEACLDRLLPAAGGARVLVVDASDSSPLPHDWSRPGVELLRVPNRSFSYAVNQALAECRTPYFVHLNADVFVEPYTLKDLLAVLRSDRTVGMAGPLALDGSGRLQDQGVPYRLWQYLTAHVPAAGWLHAAAGHGRALHAVRVPWLSGCLQAVSMEAVAAAGSLDEALRFTNEDSEWCLRLRAHGYGCALVDTAVVHLGGSSTPSDPAFLVEGLRGGMVVSRRHAAAWRAELQRLAVWGWASLASVFARTAERRAAARTVQTMFRERDFNRPVFGETLAERLLP